MVSGEARYYDPNGYSYNDLKKNAWIGGALAVNADAGFTLVRLNTENLKLQKKQDLDFFQGLRAWLEKPIPQRLLLDEWGLLLPAKH